MTIPLIEAKTHRGVLFHTTSLPALEKILRTGRIAPKDADGFVSLSEQPLFGGDISASDVSIGLVIRKVAGQLLQVKYTPTWAARYPDHARYIAGEGWPEQFEFQPTDDDEFGDDEEYDRQYAEAELQAFLVKDNEVEWISKREGGPVTFPPAAVAVLVVARPGMAARVQQLLADYPQVTIEDRSGRVVESFCTVTGASGRQYVWRVGLGVEGVGL